MKKFIAIIMSAVILSICFAACSEQAETAVKTAVTTTQKTTAPATTASTTKPAATNTASTASSSKASSKSGNSSEKSQNSGNSGGSGGGLSFDFDLDLGPDYEVKELYSNNGSHSLYGQVYVPENLEGKAPAVVLAHSYLMNGSSLNSLAKMIANEGMVAYCFDFWGGSLTSRSGGSMSDMTVFTEKDDLKSALATVRSLDYVDKNKVFLLGTSLGGCVSALVANDKPSQIKGLILMYPALLTQEQASEWSTMADFAGVNWMNDLTDYDVFSHIGGYYGDVLIIHGTADTQVPIKFSRKARDTYSSCRLIELEGAQHGFTNNSTANYYIKEFLNNHI